MEDKRITKSKRNLKAALVCLICDCPFEKISVAQLCRAGKISRITFYTYYPDKYALLNELITDYIEQTKQEYRRLQACSAASEDYRQGYLNMLQSVLNIYKNNRDFFSHITPRENPYLYSAFYQQIITIIDAYFRVYGGPYRSRYPMEQTTALLCNALWGVINECYAPEPSNEAVGETIRQMFCDILDSAIFAKP